MSDYKRELRKLQLKKRNGLKISESYDRLCSDPSKVDDLLELSWLNLKGRSQHIRDCGSYLEFGLLSGGGAVLQHANFCRERLCPACTYRRSLKAFANISRCLDWVDENDSDHKFLFLTLTVRNVKGPDLADCLSMMAAGWNRFCANKAIKSRVKGSIRTCEVTINEKDGTYHPHYHIILAVSGEYNSWAKQYLTTVEWARKWQKSCRLDYLPSTSISLIRGKAGGIKETAKYSVKDNDILSAPVDEEIDKRVYYLTKGLYGKRMLAFLGCFKAAKKALAIKDECEDDLTDTVLRKDVVQAVVVCRWNVGAYVYDTERIELDYEEWRTEDREVADQIDDGASKEATDHGKSGRGEHGGLYRGLHQCAVVPSSENKRIVSDYYCNRV